MHDDADQVTPRGAHPAFYGCYDWHSAIEMHWALIVLLRFQPDDVPADDIRSVVDAHFTPDNIATEVAYLAANARSTARTPTLPSRTNRRAPTSCRPSSPKPS